MFEQNTRLKILMDLGNIIFMILLIALPMYAVYLWPLSPERILHFLEVYGVILASFIILEIEKYRMFHPNVSVQSSTLKFIGNLSYTSQASIYFSCIMGLYSFIMTLFKAYPITMYYSYATYLFHFCLAIFPVAMVGLGKTTWRKIGFQEDTSGYGKHIILGGAIIAGFGPILRGILTNKPVQLIQLDAFSLSSILVFFTYVVVASITEEIFLRGYLQSIWKNNVKSIILSTSMFTIMHIPKFLLAPEHIYSSWSLPMLTFTGISTNALGFFSALAFVALMGFVFSGIKYVTESIYYPILMHAVINLFSCLYVIAS